MKCNEVLIEEINLIHDEKIREFTAKCLQDAPEDLTEMPTASSGKYHPPHCNIVGGLMNHFKRCIIFARIRFDSFKWTKDPNYFLRMDIIISALLLHDIGKKAKYEKDKFWEYTNHPLTAVKMIEKHKDMIDEVQFKAISEGISFHMGPWSPKSINKPIEKYTLSQLIIYQCDFDASRKDMRFDFDPPLEVSE